MEEREANQCFYHPVIISCPVLVTLCTFPFIKQRYTTLETLTFSMTINLNHNSLKHSFISPSAQPFTKFTNTGSHILSCCKCDQTSDSVSGRNSTCLTACSALASAKSLPQKRKQWEKKTTAWPHFLRRRVAP